MAYLRSFAALLVTAAVVAGCSDATEDLSDGAGGADGNLTGDGAAGTSSGDDGSGPSGDDGAAGASSSDDGSGPSGDDGAAGASSSNNGSGPSGGAVAPCDPLSAEEQPITLGTIAAIGAAQTGTIFVVDEIDTAEPRVFVSIGEELVRVRVVGGGSGSSSGVDTHELEFEAPAGGYWTLAIEIRDGETGMALVRQGDFERSFEEVLEAGEELTVLDESSIAGLAVRNLPGEITVEYIARAESGHQIVVVRPRDDWSYEDFRLFYGAGSVLTERDVQEVLRAKDGGTTWI